MTTTITTVTTVMTASPRVIAELGLVTTLILVALLISKELATTTSGDTAIRWRRSLNLGIVPLLVAFAVIVVVKLADVL